MPKRKRKSRTKRQRRRAAGGRVVYAKYMVSKAWRAKRADAISHYGGACSVCGTSESLHVHHKTYARLGRERMRDLAVLCEGCHENLHEDDKPLAADPLTREYLAMFRD